MSGSIEGENHHQATLFPEQLDDFAYEDNPARVIDLFINSLDTSGLDLRLIRVGLAARITIPVPCISCSSTATSMDKIAGLLGEIERLNMCMLWQSCQRRPFRSHTPASDTFTSVFVCLKSRLLTQVKRRPIRHYRHPHRTLRGYATR